MDRERFRNRLKRYKKAREENPGLKYWEWKALPAEKVIPKYDEGGEVENQLKYKNSKVSYDSNPSTFTKNLYNRIIPIPGTMPEGLIIGGIKQYFKNSDGRVKNLFSEKNLGPLDESQFNYIRDEIIKGNQGPIESMEPYILEDTKDLYLGMPQRHNTYEYSDYRPKNAKSKQYYKNKFLEDAASPILIDVANDIKLNKTIPKDDWMGYGKAYEITKNKNALAVLPGYGHATVGVGTDPKSGEYVSYYDKWDIGLGTEESKHPLDYIYDPVNIYGRVYLDDYYNVNSAPNKGDYYGGYLPEVKVTPKKYDEGGRVIPTQEEYITQQIDAKKAAALKKSYDRQYPKVPTSGGKRSKTDWENSLNQLEEYLNTLLSRWGITPSQKTIWLNNLKALQSQREAGYDAYIGEGKILGPSCAYTTGDNYGIDCISSELFRLNHADYGFREIPYSQVQPSDVVLDYNPAEQRATHTMMYSKKGSDGVARFNHSNGGHTAEAIRKDAKYPFKGQPLAYEFVGTPADSTQWISDYKKLYGFAEGGEVMGPPTQGLMFKKKPTIFEDITVDPVVYNYVKELSGRARYERAAHHTGSGDLANVISYMWNSNDENIPYYTGSYIRGFDPEKDYEGETTAYQGNTTVGQLTTDRTPNINRDLVKNFIYGEDKGFKKSNKKPLIVNGEVYPDRQYYGNITPIDTIYLPKSMLPTIDSLITEKSIYSMNHNSGYTPSFYRQDRMKNYTYDNVAQHSGVFHKNKRNQYSTELFDLWDFMGDYKYGADQIAHAFQKNLEPDQFFPNAGPFVLRQEIPIKFVKDNVLDETRRSGKSFLQNLNDTSNKASIRLKKFVKNWEH